MERIKTNYENRPVYDHRVYSFLKSLNLIDNKQNKIAVDLGCGHCKFSDIASVFFEKVYAVDSRTIRVPETLPKNIEFVNENAVEHDLNDYDVVICLGLLYHLTAKEQISILKKCLGKELIIDTHMSLTGKVILSEGYKGIVYKEANNLKEMINNPKASTTTLESFWFNESEFVRMLKDIGFKTIIKHLPEHYPNRTFMYVK